ncbi:MAG: hypothetical protein H6943_05005 [Zoogloeaceae bacterium]|nr:hypothetical protein [Zoogloeaceae bacterium]
MDISIFGQTYSLVESTAKSIGRQAASIQAPDGKILPDAFEFDPKSGIATFDEDSVYNLLHDAKSKTSPIAMFALMVTDILLRIVRGIRGLFGGQYSGTFGFGSVGNLIMATSAIALLLVSAAAAVIIVPLVLAAWMIRKSIDNDIAVEKSHLINQVLSYFTTTASTAA